MTCPVCDGILWVCENHADKPWRPGPNGCECGAGAPCPACNQAKHGERPKMEGDFIPALDRDKGPVH